MMDSKYLNFVPVNHPERRKTKLIAVFNKSGEYLGEIRWYAPWRQYCFYIEHDHDEPLRLILAKSCLDDISAYILELRLEHDRELTARKDSLAPDIRT